MASLPPAAPARRPDIEGLRGLAVLLVVCFHAGLSLFSGAFVAVDVFFVLSGFFLTTTLARRLAAGDELQVGDLYARRIWRLLPAMTIVLVATLLSAMLFYAPIDRAGVAEKMLPVSLFAGNLAFAATGVNYFHAGENPLLHAWTLGVEWQLALLLPALVVGFAAYGRTRAKDATPAEAREIVMRTVFGGVAFAGVASFIVATIVNEISPMWAYFGPHTRLWAFAAGAAMSFFVGGGQSVVGTTGFRVALAQLTGMAMLLGSAFFYNGGMAYPGLIALVPVGGTLLLIGGGDRAPQTWLGRLLGSGRLASLGSISFAWYLWHWPAMVLGAVLFPAIGPWGRFACGLLAIIPARLTQRFVEGTVRERLMPVVSKSRPLLWAAGVSAALVLVSLWAAASSRAYVANSEHRVFAAARNDRMPNSCWAQASENGWGDGCAFGDKSSTTTLALLGDSHAEHWLGGLDRAGKERGWRIESYVMGGCPASNFSGLLSGARAERWNQCAEYREATISAVIAARPSAVILSSSDYYVDLGDGKFSEYRVSEEVWREAQAATYARLSRAGIPVVVLRDVPLVPFDVPSCLSRRAAKLLFAGDCTFVPDGDFIGKARAVQNDAARWQNVRFVEMNDVVCPTPRCTTERNGLIVYTDDDHLTASFARSVGSTLGARIDAALQKKFDAKKAMAGRILEWMGRRLIEYLN
jgi:peptidoglycan/LPS O-acetylase OafA/YrhL